MKLTPVPGFVAGALFASLLATAWSSPRPFRQEPGEADMKAMMERAKQYMQPGEHHQLLKRFLGDWATETRMFMGDQATPPTPGTANFHWLVEGRWLQQDARGSMMGMPLEVHSWLGYDNFKQSYVSTDVNSIETAMRHAEGDLLQDGSALILYGTLDEYLTGENDKMVKYAWRFVSDDEMALEVHDLPIGETNTKVVEVRYKRKK